MRQRPQPFNARRDRSTVTRLRGLRGARLSGTGAGEGDAAAAAGGGSRAGDELGVSTGGDRAP